MKTQNTLIALALFITGFSFGQNTFPTTGNVGIGTQTPQSRLSILGGHTDTKFSLFSTGNGSATTQAELSLWASEPGVTWTGVGIGNNIHNYKTGVGGLTLINTARGGSYMRLLDNAINFNTVSSAGVDKMVMRLDESGNVGIGTTAPSAKLQVLGNIITGNSNGQEGAVSLGNASHGLRRTVNNVELYTNGADGNLLFSTLNQEKMRIIANGNVGIGTQTPASKLQVAGSITLSLPGTTEASEEGITFAANHRFSYDGKYLNHYGFGFYPYSKSNDPNGVNTYMSGYYGLDLFTQDINRMRILQNGNVGIGTTTPDAKLTVNGTIHTKEVRIDLSSPMTVPDYVFANEYQLKTLNEVDQYIKANSHLPEIPSAAEMVKNGMLVSEMNLSLLKKIEELTLYLIEQNKQIEILKTEVKELKK